jgi:hypothetical protein
MTVSEIIHRFEIDKKWIAAWIKKSRIQNAQEDSEFIAAINEELVQLFRSELSASQITISKIAYHLNIGFELASKKTAEFLQNIEISELETAQRFTVLQKLNTCIASYFSLFECIRDTIRQSNSLVHNLAENESFNKGLPIKESHERADRLIWVLQMAEVVIGIFIAIVPLQNYAHLLTGRSSNQDQSQKIDPAKLLDIFRWQVPSQLVRELKLTDKEHNLIRAMIANLRFINQAIGELKIDTLKTPIDVRRLSNATLASLAAVEKDLEPFLSFSPWTTQSSIVIQHNTAPRFRMGSSVRLGPRLGNQSSIRNHYATEQQLARPRLRPTRYRLVRSCSEQRRLG